MPAIARPDAVRRFLLEQIGAHHSDVTRLAVAQFGLSRQMVARYLRALTDEGLLEATGNTKGRSYRLRTLVDEAAWLDVTPDLREDAVWRREIAPLLDGLRPNVLDLFQQGVTAMLANVLDHAASGMVYVNVSRNALRGMVTIGDFGTGIWANIQQQFGLDDPHDAPLELVKGKLAPPDGRQAGHGILLTARLFDCFSLTSGGLTLRYEASEDAWQRETAPAAPAEPGTVAVMELALATRRMAAGAAARFAAAYGNAAAPRTLVPVNLARHSDSDQLVARSQARRVLARLDQFQEVTLDFRGVPLIGQPFADEIFRVFRSGHPHIKLTAVNTAPEVRRMIRNASAGVVVEETAKAEETAGARPG